MRIQPEQIPAIGHSVLKHLDPNVIHGEQYIMRPIIASGILQVEIHCKPRIRDIACERRNKNGLLVGQADQPECVWAVVRRTDMAESHSAIAIERERGPGRILGWYGI